MNEITAIPIGLLILDVALRRALETYLAGLRAGGLRFEVVVMSDLPADPPPHLLIVDSPVDSAAYAEANIIILGAESATHPSLTKPIRLGALADLVLRLARRAPVIAIGLHKLYPQARRLLRADGVDVALTEKEVDILAYLQQNASAAAPASRETLLAAVWNYREGVSTHTLETHIYRLRQKLEKDPEAPQILLTAQGRDGEGGYYLGV